MPQLKPGPVALAMLALFPHAESSAAQAAGAEHTLPEVRIQAAPEDPGYRSDATRTGVRTETLLKDIPQSVTVINRAVLDAQGAASLQDALRYVPGITMSAGEGGAIGNNINLRGFSARTDLYLDGMRDRGQYYRDTFFLDSVEVLKGPSSMLFGRGSTGGVINQTSKAPELKPHGEASVTVGTGDYYRSTADVNRPLTDTSALRIAVMAQDFTPRGT